jgi:hypothetical protein
MRNALLALWMLLCSVTSAVAQVSVSIGINLPVYPQFVPVPGYPVYYAPQVNSNYFFYDGMYWVYERDNWYASSWYNGPWGLVVPEAVPLFVLRVPVRYYRQPPAYFRGWRSDAPPRWGEHWGNEWDQRRHGWVKWDRRAAPPPAPLPKYQQQYSGNLYPRAEQQQVLQSQNYRYQPHDPVVKQHYQAQRVQSVPAPSPQGRLGVPQKPAAAQAPPQQGQPTAQHQRPQPQQGAAEPEQQAQRSQDPDKGHQAKGTAHEPKKKGQEKGREKGEQRDGEPAN